MVDDRLRLEDVSTSLFNGELIESYPRDFPFPSCLVYGRNRQGEPIHSVWAFDEIGGVAILVTVYRPNPNRWIDFKIRRPG